MQSAVQTTRTEGRGSLEAAVRQAIAESLADAEELRRATVEMTEWLQAKANDVVAASRPLFGDHAENPEILTGIGMFETVAASWANEVGELFERQRGFLATFNIALFGRTGAGKSTLIEAMTNGNGASVSKGESDWTTEVYPRKWEECQIFDTPGINGWGRTFSRADLEDKARNVVELADFVIVCFDSQSQQAEEFRKLAEWVQTYNKPLIAVLNARNPMWRFPERVSSRFSRQNLATQIRQHGANISDELAKIGLPGTPIVAISSQRALFARAATPFEGPGLEELTGLRRDYGSERLLELSNFGALESLLATTISRHSVQLRLGVLRDQVRGIVRSLCSELDELALGFQKTADLLENDFILPMLRLVGYPSTKNPEKRAWFQHSQLGTNILNEVERLRGGSFSTGIQGVFGQYVRSRTQAELGSLRQRSLRQADRLVDEAFDRGKEISPEQFEAGCLDKQRVEEACNRVLEQARSFLERETALLAGDFESDLEALGDSGSPMASFEGKSARAWKNWGRALKIGGILAGAGGAVAVTLSALGLANIWNPAGWAILAGTAILSLLFGWAGSAAMKHAKRKKLEARQKASGEARAAIHDWYNQQEQRIETAAERCLQEASEVILVVPLSQELVMLRLASTCAAMHERAAELASSLPDRANPLHCLMDGMRAVELLGFPETPNRGNLVWFGEGWIDDPLGLKADERVFKPQQRTTSYDPGPFQLLKDKLRQIFRGGSRSVSLIPGQEWFEKTLRVCADDETALKELSELEEFRNGQQPGIYLVGDYNTGKSSLIKRLLIDEGQLVSEELDIRGDPTTSKVSAFEWGRLKLIDTPGFQSGDSDHEARTLRGFSLASLLIYVFHPNLILGDEQAMRLVLNGDRALGLVPKKNRTIFLINRCDEMGCDPSRAPAHFRQLVERKKTELSLALQSRGIDVEPEQIQCVAGDPFGLMGDRKDAGSKLYDQHRSWDGIGSLREALAAVREELFMNGISRSLLEGGLHRLSMVAITHESEVSELREQIGFLSASDRQLEKAIEEGGREAAAENAKLVRQIESFTDNLIDRCMAAEGADKLQELAQEVNKWWEHPGLNSDFEQWSRDAAEHFREWCDQIEDQLRRRWESREFKAVFGNHDGEAFRYEGPKGGSNVVAKGAGEGAKLLKGASRDVVLRIGRDLGHKFKPWGAVKMSKNLTRAGAVLAWVGVALDIWEFWKAENREAKEERERKRMRAAVAGEVPKVARMVAYGDEGDPSIVAQFESVLAEFGRRRQALAEEMGAINAKIGTLEKRVQRCRELCSEAEVILNHPWQDEHA